ncbi:MAG: hypothetical protein JRI97_13200 [Deltaproteobacteria bacterium]|nr:hypothetical protein [Deltaproteobacteria bacterium]
MKDLFAEVLGIDSVLGGLVVSNEGKVLFSQFNQAPEGDPAALDWQDFVTALDQSLEADLVFENRRLFARRMATGYVIIVAGLYAPISSIRLCASALAPAVEKQTQKGGFLKLFRRN